MNVRPCVFVNLIRTTAMALLLLCIALPAFSQDSAKPSQGVPDDWTHHHVIFSNPGTMQDAIRNGTYEHWLRVQIDPRFKMQQLQRKTVPLPPSDEAGIGNIQRGKLERDWNVTLGSAGVAATMYPAKYSFSIENASCSDFAVFPVDAAGAAAVAAKQNGVFSSVGTPTGSVTITNGSDSITLTATTGASSSSCTSTGTNHTGSFNVVLANGANDAATLAALINAPNCGSFVGVSATSSSETVTVTATTGGTSGNSIALSKTLTAFTWGGSTLSGGVNGQANLLGLTNLYSGTGGLCGAAPTVLFSYEVGTGTVETSPVLSLGGTKLAYVESITGGSKFHVLTLGTTGSNGTSATSPVTPGTGNNAADTAITMNGSVSVTLGSPYYDYTNDIAYVGDNSGKLHKFTPVFNGTPAEITTGGWPITVSSGNILTGPTLDSTSGNIFVGDSVGVLRFVSTVAHCGVTAPPCVGTTTVNVGTGGSGGTASGRPIIDPPVVDSSTGMVFAYDGCGLPAGGSCGPGNGFGEVMQATTALASPKWIELGVGSGTNNMHIGAFDNFYYEGPVQDGHLYICGQPSLLQQPTLYQVGFNSSGVMTTASSSTLDLATNSGGDNAEECSPLTEIYNSTTETDWLFLSVANFCNATGGGTAGCVQNFNITSGFPTGGASAAAPESVGTSAIIVDNVSTAGQASSIYFGTLSGGANESIKLTQAGLQ
jgi:hypothetical protein